MAAPEITAEGDPAAHKTRFASGAVMVAIPASILSGTWDLVHGRYLPAVIETLYFLTCLAVQFWRATPSLGRARRLVMGVGLSLVAIVYGYADPTRIEHLMWLPLFPLGLVLGATWKEAMAFVSAIALAHVGIYGSWWLTHGTWPIAPSALIEVAVVYTLSTVLVRRFETFMAQHVRALALLAETDPLTGIANRRRFFRSAEHEALRAKRHGTPWSVLWIDLDHFKAINDTFGHDTGDAVLRTVADRLRRHLRDVDLVARVGGEEFAVLLPATDTQGAAVVAQRLRASIENEPAPTGSPVTCSLGVAEAARGEALANVCRRADAALYEAKQAGRNRVVVAPQPEPLAQAGAAT